jgi:Cytochrome P450
MPLMRRPSLWHHVVSWDRRPSPTGVIRLTTGAVLVTDPKLANYVLVRAHLYEEQSAFLRTRSWRPLPFEVRNEVIRGLMSALDLRHAPSSTMLVLDRRGVLTPGWGIWWMRRLFHDTIACDRPAVFDTAIDAFVDQVILGDDVGGSFRRTPAPALAELYRVLGDAIVIAGSQSHDPGDLVSVVANLDLALPPVEQGELFTRLVHSVISFTGIALEWAVLMACRDDSFRAALRAGEDVRHFLWELQRLYPTAWRLVRQACADHQIGDVQVAAGDDVIVATAALHRSEAHWKRSKEYLPTRWTEADLARDRAFIPFGKGRGMCPGRSAALEAIQDSLHSFYDRYEIIGGRRAHRSPYVRSILAPPRVRLRARARAARVPGCSPPACLSTTSELVGDRS